MSPGCLGCSPLHHFTRNCRVMPKSPSPIIAITLVLSIFELLTHKRLFYDFDDLVHTVHCSGVWQSRFLYGRWQMHNRGSLWRPLKMRLKLASWPQVDPNLVDPSRWWSTHQRRGQKGGDHKGELQHIMSANGTFACIQPYIRFGLACLFDKYLLSFLHNILHVQHSVLWSALCKESWEDKQCWKTYAFN